MSWRYSIFLRRLIHCTLRPHSSSLFSPSNSTIPIQMASNLRIRRHFGDNASNNNKSNSTQQQNLPICWHCGKTVRQRISRVLCTHCRHIQPLPQGIDYFAYLGIDDPNFAVDGAELKKRFIQMQTLVHPDKYSGCDEHEVNLSQQHSAFLNNAYRTLKNPFSRAEYLLSLLERLKDEVSDFAHENVADLDEGTVEETEVAAEMMELMESIEQLKEDSPEVRTRIAQLDAELLHLLRQAHEQMMAKELEEARRTLRRISYLRRSRRILEAKLGDERSGGGGRWGDEHDV